MAKAVPPSTTLPSRVHGGAASHQTPRSSAPATSRAKRVKYRALPEGIAKKVTVLPGDNLSVIAKRNRISLAALLSFNERLATNGRTPGLVYSGDEVLIPRASTRWGRAGSSPGISPPNSEARPRPAARTEFGGADLPSRPAPRPPRAQTFSSDSATSEQLALAFDSVAPVLFASRVRLPETKAQRLALVKRLHRELGVTGPSERLSKAQLTKLFGRVGAELGIRPEFLRYMAGTESDQRQTASTASAHGIMQIERSAHRDAYVGALNVGNDTVTNVVYGALLRAQTDRAMRQCFKEAGLNPPTRASVVEFLGDLAYSRGPGLLRHIAHHAKMQGIEVNRFADYVGGRGGRFELKNGRVRVFAGPGTAIASTGAGSVLASALADVNRKQPVRLSSSYQDRNGDGRVSHLDIWVTRGMKYIDFLRPSAAQGSGSV